MIRVIIPDSHGSMIDVKARDAFLGDLKALDADEVVLLGDHVDASGLYSKFARKSQEDMEYSYDADLEAANEFLDKIQAICGNADYHYIEGNHEAHIERWAVENLAHERDVARFLRSNSPATQLKLKERGMSFYRQAGFYHGLSIRNTIRLGKCHFTHGICAGKFATAQHVARFGACVVHGHTHRAQEHKVRTVAKGAIMGACPGTLAQLQPTYMHTQPTDWTHGYGLQYVMPKTGTFQHLNVTIVDGVSLLQPLTDQIRAGRSHKKKS